MPYKSIDELPDSVKDNISKHAQDIYKEAFNSAYDEYKDPSDRRDNADREVTAHKVAWSAIKKAGYKKGSDEKWHKEWR